MVHVTLESKLSFGQSRSRHQVSSNLYRVVINGEDGEYYEYDSIEAESFSEACRKGQALAHGMMDVQYIEVYQIQSSSIMFARTSLTTWYGLYMPRVMNSRHAIASRPTLQ